jgi:hypothetical protein
VGQGFAGERPKKRIAPWSGFWEAVDRIGEKARTVRALADVLSVASGELESNTLRSLGILILCEMEGLLEALVSLVRWARRKAR